MHPVVYKAFQKLLTEIAPEGGWKGRVLEVGAVRGKDNLLALPELASMERIGVNIGFAVDFDGIRILKCNGNSMPVFEDGSFDLVVSNATLEHDQRFWLTCAEIRRVTKPGGFAMIGVPGFDPSADVASTLGLPKPAGPGGNGWETTTLTYKYHGHPYDYYRFSERALREVFMEGFEVLAFRNNLIPPRLLVAGKRLEN